MAGIDGLVQQAINDMRAKSSEEIITQASFYLTKIKTIQSKISMLSTSTTLDELASLQGEAKATQISINDSKKVAMNKLMLDGYHVLSELGAWVGSRDSTNYTVVVTGLDTHIKYSWDEMSFEEFADMIDFSGIGPYGYSGRKLVLKNSATLLEEFKDTATSWGNRTSAYDAFDKAVRQLITDGNGNILTWKKNKKSKKERKFKWQNVTKGNTLEAFLRYERLKLENPDLSEERLMFLAMDTTMAKPAPFYQGGDLGNTQIKGDYATIAQNSTIRAMLDFAYGRLLSLIQNLSVAQGISSRSSPSISADLSAQVSQAIEKEIQELVLKFVESLSR